MAAVIDSPERGVNYDALDALTRRGHFYRGMSEAELVQAFSRGYFESDQRYCVPGEGTCFSLDAADAASYTNFGRTDPRKTGTPNFIVEVEAAPSIKIDRDGYPKVKRLPVSYATRVWAVFARGQSLVLEEVDPVERARR
jgi:hypothetical protein